MRRSCPASRRVPASPPSSGSTAPTKRDAPAPDGGRRPLVSIVVPVYNGAAFLPASLGSILAQSHANIEVIVMDDASTDETPAVARELVSRHPDRARYVRQPANRGQFGNVNAGIALAAGEYVAVFHADDVYDPEIVAREVEFLERHPEVGAVFCLDRFLDADGREYDRLRLIPDIPPGVPLRFPQVLNALLAHKNRFLVGPSAMVRRIAYESVGVNRPEFGIASDLDMWVRIARAYPIAVLPEHLMGYRHFHGNSTQQYFALRTEEERFFAVMDACLAAGGRDHATAAALADYAAHRAEDRLMRAVNHYIRGSLREARALLGEIRAATIARSRRVQRWRLLVLVAGLRVAARLPRVPALARAMHRRWHEPRAPR